MKQKAVPESTIENTFNSLGRYKFPNMPYIGDWIHKLSVHAVSSEPWPHAVIDDFLPKELYSGLAGVLPRKAKPDTSAPRSWVQLSETERDGKRVSGRLAYYDRNETDWWGKAIKPYLTVLSFLFRNEDTFDALCRLFAPHCPKRMSYPKSCTVFCTSRLNHDSEAYDLHVHTDVPSKFLTLLIYFPLGAGSEGGGTSLYYPPASPPITPTSISPNGYKYYSPSDFKLAKKVAFKPNSCLIFPRTEASWHGKPLEKQEARPDRFTYQVNYSIAERDAQRLHLYDFG